RPQIVLVAPAVFRLDAFGRMRCDAIQTLLPRRYVALVSSLHNGLRIVRRLAYFGVRDRARQAHAAVLAILVELRPVERIGTFDHRLSRMPAGVVQPLSEELWQPLVSLNLDRAPIRRPPPSWHRRGVDVIELHCLSGASGRPIR